MTGRQSPPPTSGGKGLLAGLGCVSNLLASGTLVLMGAVGTSVALAISVVMETELLPIQASPELAIGSHCVTWGDWAPVLLGLGLPLCCSWLGSGIRSDTLGWDTTRFATTIVCPAKYARLHTTRDVGLTVAESAPHSSSMQACLCFVVHLLL